MAYNMSLLMRTTIGIGTPKQWLAAVAAASETVFRSLTSYTTIRIDRWRVAMNWIGIYRQRSINLRLILRGDVPQIVKTGWQSDW